MSKTIKVTISDEAFVKLTRIQLRLQQGMVKPLQADAVEAALITADPEQCAANTTPAPRT